MNISKKLILFLVLGIWYLVFADSAVHAQTIDPSVWQTGAQGLSTTSNTERKTAGLGFVINTVDNNSAASWPFLQLHGGINEAGNGGNGPGAWGPMFIDLGLIKPTATTTANTPAQSFDWTHNSLNFNSGTIRLTASRLTPALWVQNNAASIRLFAGNVSGANMLPSQWAPFPIQTTRRIAAPSSPKYVAFHTSTGYQVQPLSNSNLNLSGIDQNWILVWYGNNSHFVDTKRPVYYPFPLYSDHGDWGIGAIPTAEGYQADAPLLLRFQFAPTAIVQSSEGGVDLSFAGTSNNFTILPLLGRDHPTTANTESWVSGLPQNIIDKINFWSDRLCQFPTNASEAFAYNQNSDTATITENITYSEVCGTGIGTKFAPVPPYLALAKDKLPITFSNTATDPKLFTEFGPFLGIDNTDNYTWSLAGLKTFTDNKRVLSGSGTPPSELTQELSNQVDKFIQASPLAPWLPAYRASLNAANISIYFNNPSDILYHLSEIYPAISSSQQNSLLSTMRTIRQDTPPETTANLPLGQGTRRQNFDLGNPSPFYPGAFDVYNHARNGYPWLLFSRAPLYNLYGLSRYYDLSGDSLTPASDTWQAARNLLNQDMAEQDWATGYWFAQVPDKRVATEDINRHFAGLLGFIRLAKIAGDGTNEDLARVLLAKATASRIALLTYPRALDSNGLVQLPSNADWHLQYISGRVLLGALFNPSWTSANDDTRQITYLNQFGAHLYDSAAFMKPFTGWNEYARFTSAYINAYKDMVPELGRLLKQYDQSEAVIYLNKYKSVMPHWYIAFLEQFFAGERNLSAPADPFQLFNAQAWIAGDSPQNLATYTDMPWIETGDLFYMQKLAETIKAYQGVKWEDELVSPSPSATPTPCTISSVSWPNGMSSVTEGSNVNISVQASGECNTKQVHLTVRRQVAFQSDVDATNQPNPRDVTLTLTGNTATASATWIADTWSNACTLTTCNPTFFVRGNIVGETQEVTTDRNNDLVVTQSQTVPTDPNDWPQVNKDPQHTGYSAETFNINYSRPAGERFKVSWTYPFQPDRIHPIVQAIIYQGKAFVGTEGANGQTPSLYALDAATPDPTSPAWAPKGSVIWKFTVDGPILNSVAAYDGKVFVATLNGSVYAIDMNGNQLWQTKLDELGFSAAPIIADNKIMIGSHGGNFYGLDPNSGNTLWSYSTGTPIMMTAAFNKGTDGIGRAVFGGMNMHVYAINTADGSLAWRSPKIPGAAFKEYWPVMSQGKVIITPLAKKANAGINPGFPFSDLYSSSPSTSWDWYNTNGPIIAAGNLTQVADAMAAQDRVMQDYQNNPGKYADKIIYLLDETTGQETSAVPNWNMQSLSGAQTPPCIDRDNNLVIPVNFLASGWGRLDLKTNRVVDLLHDGNGYNGQPYSRTNGPAAGVGNLDETLNPTCAGNTIFSFHVQEGNANYTGAFDLDQRRWTQINHGYTNRQMSTQLEGRSNPASISNGKIYHVSYHELIVREVNP